MGDNTQNSVGGVQQTQNTLINVTPSNQNIQSKQYNQHNHSTHQQHDTHLTQEELLILEKLKNNPQLMDKLLHNNNLNDKDVSNLEEHQNGYKKEND